MKKQKMFELADKVIIFIKTELKGESIIDVGTATVLALGVLASEEGDILVLPETICRHALTNLSLVRGDLYDNFKNS